uniref:Peptide deformylase n=1 Tax=Nothoprocta perdicaria TaxID=30464 RepID=A0A8C6YYX9_NOTPE
RRAGGSERLLRPLLPAALWASFEGKKACSNRPTLVCVGGCLLHPAALQGWRPGAPLPPGPPGSNVPVHTRTPAPVHNHAPVPVHTRTAAPVHNHTPVPVHTRTAAPVHNHAPVPVHTRTAAPVHNHAPAPVYNHAPVPVHNHAPVPVHTRTAAPVPAAGVDELGEPVSWEATGWTARIIQHEMDHLDGVLFIDRMDSRTFANVHWMELLE